jgi:glycosyltransferase involved in cell wall biosynthesis
MKKILFLTREFGVSGSEMLLLYILNNLDENKYKSFLFTKQKGALLYELPAYIESHVSYKFSKKPFCYLFGKILSKLKINPLFYQLKKLQHQINADFWYVNTVINPEYYDIAKKLGVKVITHAHELPTAYSINTAKEMSTVFHGTDLLIGCAKIVCNKFEEMGHQNTKLLYGFIDHSKIKLKLSKEEARKKIGLLNDDFVWAISGHTIPTKGIEFLIPLMQKLHSNAKIIWIGQEIDRGINFYVKEALKNKFPDRVMFLGQQREFYYDYLNAADAFLLLSREDSFPLVMIEAAYLGKPIASFNSGGVAEFVNDDIGVIVPDWNAESLANVMLKMENSIGNYNPQLIKSYSLAFEADTQIKKLEDILANFN